MSSVNKVILVGRLGTDPKVQVTQSGQTLCRMSLATTRSYKDSDARDITSTCWHRIVVWGKQGELCQTYLRKGRQVYIEGHLQTSSYIDKSGNKKYSTDVVSETVVFLQDDRTQLNLDAA